MREIEELVNTQEEMKELEWRMDVLEMEGVVTVELREKQRLI